MKTITKEKDLLNQRIDVALAYMSLHDNDNLKDWIPENQRFLGVVFVYICMLSGVYGDVFVDRLDNDVDRISVELNKNMGYSKAPAYFEILLFDDGSVHVA